MWIKKIVHHDIVSLSIVKNEADIIESMVRRNLQFIDFMFFVDNGSADGTLEILQALSKETRRVRVVSDLRIGHMQQKIINENIKYIKEKISLNHLILLDGDEIIIADKDVFYNIIMQSEAPLLLPWKTFVATPSDDWAQSDPVRRITHHRTKEKPQYYKVTVPKEFLNLAEVTAGSHFLCISEQKVDSKICNDISLGHWPVRNKDQIICKALIGSWGMRQRNRGRSEGYQWHAIAEKYLDAGEFSEIDFYNFGLMYAAKKRVNLVKYQGGENLEIEIKYSHFINKSPLFLVSKFVEEIFDHQTKIQ